MQSNLTSEINRLKLVYFIVLLLGWFILAFFFAFNCCSKKTEPKHIHDLDSHKTNSVKQPVKSSTDTVKKDSAEAEAVSGIAHVKLRGAPFSVAFTHTVKSDTKPPKFDVSESFHFPKNDFIHTVVVSERLQKNLQRLKSYFEGQSHKRLVITGTYVADEKNISMFPNLGFARAHDIKNYFVQLGFYPRQIDVQSKLVHSNPKQETVKNNILYSMAEFSAHDLTSKGLITEKNKIALIKERINTNPLILRFELSKSEVTMTDKQRQKTKSIIEYVGKVKDAKVIVEGHTDSLGTDEDNLELGKIRAQYAARFIEDNGLDKKYITIRSQGERKTISDDSTKAAREENRRAVITID